MVKNCLFSHFFALIGGIMLTIISFILTILGSLNWLLIGLLQYDFVAGIFGYQGSVFSRLIYIIIGASCVMLVVKLVKGKGTIAVFSKRNKKDLAKHIEKMQTKAANVESANESVPSKEEHFESNQEIDDDAHFGHYQPEINDESRRPSEEYDGLFDEHFNE